MFDACQSGAYYTKYIPLPQTIVIVFLNSFPLGGLIKQQETNSMEERNDHTLQTHIQTQT